METIELEKGTFHVTSDEGVAMLVKDLGMGLAICVRDEDSRVAGICSIMVPYLKNGASPTMPSFDCNNGLRAFFKQIADTGGKREKLKTWLVGVGQFLDCPKELNVGIHLYSLVKKTFEKYGVAIEGEFCGGPFNRSVQFGLTVGPYVTAPGSTKEK